MRATILTALSCAVAMSGHGQENKDFADSTRHIDEVVVSSRYAYKEVIPSQTLCGKELERLNSLSVADALRYFSGLQIKDYGGVGGIKTVNIRSMGTNHLGIYYDGIELGNAQNGQVDLGQFSLDNVEQITLYNGQRSRIFQSAADFGNAGSIYIRTRRPRFDTGKGYNVAATVRYGSSDLVRASVLYEQKLAEDISLSFNAEGLTSSGEYEFRYRRKNLDGTVAYDTTATRHNGDIKAVRVEGNLYGTLGGGDWGFKAYTYHSERGIPGAIVNNVWRRGERQWDHNTFAQASYTRRIGSRFDTRLNVKYAYYDTRYVNNDTTQMLVDNNYKQQEIYVSSANVYDILRGWSVSASYDFRWNKLDSDMRDFASPHRFQNMVSLATAFDRKWIMAQASIFATVAKDHVRRGSTQKAVHKFAPALFVSLRPFGDNVFLIRAFAKRSFRLPTFNDLYYTDMGNARLKPETATQYNLGATFDKSWRKGLVRNVTVQVDGYYNEVHDKIVAYPKGQQFRWTMLNLGLVHIKGVDVEATVATMPVEGLSLTGRVQYTFQRAIDVTNPKDSYYRDQIPYIPRHSGSALINAEYRGWSLNYSFIYAGERYNQKENIRYNYMQPWYTSDLSLAFEFRMGNVQCRATAEVNNLLDQDYDVIANYPMPGRNYAVTLDIKI